MAAASPSKSLVLVIFLTLILSIQPLKPMERYSNGLFSLAAVLNKEYSVYWPRYATKLIHPSCGTITIPSSLRARAGIYIIKVTLLAVNLVLLAGDISENPGPIKYPCGVCLRGCRVNQRAVQCDGCDIWFHTKCTGISQVEYANLSKPESNWFCMGCIALSEMAKTRTEKDDFNFPFDSLSDESFNSLFIQESVVSHETTIASEASSDCNDREDVLHSIACELNTAPKDLRIGHLNIRSLRNKIDELRLLQKICRFDILAITE